MALGVLAFLLPGPVTAQTSDVDVDEPDHVTSPDATFLDTVTVAATRSERTLETTPGHIDVIKADEIEQRGYTDIVDLIRYTPGVYVDNDVTRLGTNGFNIRGVGGNRVLTQVDGIPTAEQFDFGPFSVTQYTIDLDTLERAEIVRSAGSALYGSDALGGVVSLVTRSPGSYLGGAPQYVGLRAGFDNRSEQASASGGYAAGNDRWQGSLVFTHRDGEAQDNQGGIDSSDLTRTTPNPIDRSSGNALLKLVHSPTNGSLLAFALEWFDGETETEILSSRRPASPFSSAVLDADAVDTQERQRFSVEHSLLPNAAVADSLIWRAYWQQSDTAQVTTSLRDGVLGPSDRDGAVRFDQETFGFEAEARKALGSNGKQVLTYGLLLRNDVFDGLRDRSEFVTATGEPVPTTLTFPTKYFPESEVNELGLFVQGEFGLANDRLRLVPGLRFDRFDLKPNENDTIFQNGNPGQPDAVSITSESVSPKLGLVFSLTDQVSLFAQYARGFRAPPMSAVNNGFTNPVGGYRTLPNAELEAETSDNLELGLRGRYPRGGFSIAAFDNRYDDFIQTVFLGFNPAAFLVEFQPQNIDQVEITGIEIAGDLRVGQAWRARLAYAYIEGANVTDDEPLETIAPPTLVAGLRYARPGSRWGIEASTTFVAAKDESDLRSDSTQFPAPAYEVFDLAAWVTLSERFTLQLSAWNLGDETYWTWNDVRGQALGSPTLDRYTSPGRSFGVQARARF